MMTAQQQIDENRKCLLPYDTKRVLAVCVLSVVQE